MRTSNRKTNNLIAQGNGWLADLPQQNSFVMLGGLSQLFHQYLPCVSSEQSRSIRFKDAGCGRSLELWTIVRQILFMFCCFNFRLEQWPFSLSIHDLLSIKICRGGISLAIAALFLTRGGIFSIQNLMDFALCHDLL